MLASAKTAFSTVVIDTQGRISTHQIEAQSAEEARQLAARNGHTVLECGSDHANRTSRNFLPKLRWIKTNAIDTVSFSQDLATLMEAGVTVKEAVEALAAKEPVVARRQILSQLNRAMSEGRSFSAALEQSSSFPPLLVATVAASEQTGDLGTGLSRYAKHQQSLRAVTDQVIGACVYPLLLLAVGSVVVLMLLGVVVPRFSTLIDSQNRELPVLSRMLMAWGQFVDAYPAVPVAMLAAFVGLAAFIVVQWNNPDRRKRWLEKIPGVAGLVREFQHLQMYRTTAILTSRGITIHKALGFSMNLLGMSDRERLRAALVHMHEGVAISRALSSSGLSDVVATSMLNVAERSGSLSEMLDRIADFYERALQRRMNLASKLIEPVLMIIFGIVIGGIVVLMYLPIFDLASSFS